MKRYLAFGGAHYYPGGGMNDLIGAFDTREAAEDAVTASACDWGHVVDLETLEGDQIYMTPGEWNEWRKRKWPEPP